MSQLTALCLATALYSTVIPNPAGIKDLALLEGLWRTERLATSCLGNTTSVTEAGHSRRKGGQDREKARCVHFEMLVVLGKR